MGDECINGHWHRWTRNGVDRGSCFGGGNILGAVVTSKWKGRKLVGKEGSEVIGKQQECKQTL